MCCGSAERPPGLLAPHQFGALGFSKLQARGHTGATALSELGKHVKAKHSKAQAEHSDGSRRGDSRTKGHARQGCRII